MLTDLEGRGRIMVVDDDPDVSAMLRTYFTMQGYEVDVVSHGADVLPRCHRHRPDLVLLDIMLPDVNGYEVCRELRSDLYTNRIPIIFLTQKHNRTDRLAGLALGSDDYVTKPFNVEELKLRVRNVLRRARFTSSTDPVSGLPSGKLIEERFRQLLHRSNWAVMYVGIEGFELFTGTYRHLRNEFIAYVAKILREAVEELGTFDDFVGHVGRDNFVIITMPSRVQALQNRITGRFDRAIRASYQKQAGNDQSDQEPPALSLALTVGVVTRDDGPFPDIRSIAEAVSRVRREAQNLVLKKHRARHGSGVRG
ncbi:MAG: response regulator [Chloroflexota bacterium]|nr:MAG: response regulator [Chloroflexota bacterium]